MYIYKTTNIINGKIYVGKKEAEKFDPTYFGSGKLIKQSIIKKGSTDHLICEVLEYCDSSNINEREMYWIDHYKNLEVEMYNLAGGGTGGNTLQYYSDSEREEVYKKRSEKRIGTKLSDTTRKNMSESAKKRAKDKPHTIPDNSGRIFSEGGYKNMCDAAMKRRGEITITNGYIEKKILQTDQAPEGWWRGRSFEVKEKILVGSKKTISPESNEKRSKTLTGNICYTNGSKTVRIKPGQTPPEGWWKGMTKRKRK